MIRTLSRLLLPFLILLGLVGCASDKEPKHPTRLMIGESVVLAGEEPAFLANMLTATQNVTLRSTYSATPSTILYQEGVDYVVDHAAGSLRRTPGSRIPDFRQNVLYGQQDFDHTKFPGFGNTAYFAFATYPYNETNAWPVQRSQVQFLPKSRAKLAGGRPLKILAYGDSITAGGDATRPELIFWERWAQHLRDRYPLAKISAVNVATGGDSTVQGLSRLKSKVLDQQPDLVLVGFGMNDHNKGGPTPAKFESNLLEIIGRIRTETGAEIILFPAFPPNPKWKFGSNRMIDYALATEHAAAVSGCAFANVYSNWETMAARKKPEDLLGNNINHPNDFGHWIYFEVLRAIGL